MLTPDDALDSYRDRRAADPELDTESLKRAREVLDAVGFCIRGKDADNWRRLDQAWEIIQKITPPPPEEEPAPKPKPAEKAEPPKTEAKAAPEPVAPAEPKPVAPPPPVKPVATKAPPVVLPPPVSQPSPVSQSAGASPWAAAQATAAEAPSAPEAPTAPEVPSGYETGAVDIAKVMGGAKLPFHVGPAVAPPAAASTADEAPPAASPPADEAPPAIDPYETEAIDMTKIDLDVMPFSQPRPDVGAATSAGATAPELTLEQYASMCAELQSDPNQAGAVYARYGAADEATSHALQTSWQAKLGADANEQARFDALVAQYVTQLRSR